MRKSFPLPLILLLAACNGAGPTEAPSAAVSIPSAAFPTNYRQLAKEYIHENFFDPYSVRDAGIATPKLRGNKWLVCFRTNAKNRMGGYVGLSNSAFYVQDGKAVEDFWGTAASGCANEVFEPFPEATEDLNASAAPVDAPKPISK